MKIFIKLFNHKCAPVQIPSKGDWIDLRAAKTIHLINTNLPPYNNVIIPLGVAMKLPKYFEAIVVPRSSTYKNYGIMLANNTGIIDNSFCGDKDEWKFHAIYIPTTPPPKHELIEEGDRICQFRIMPNQFAPIWVKLKWLLTNKIKFVETLQLESANRGQGVTGLK